MVFLFNKAKIYSYIVAVTTVVILFVVAANVNTEDMAIQASTIEKATEKNIINTISENRIENKIDNKTINEIE